MKSLLKISLLLVLAVTFFACPSDDDSSSDLSLRDYQEVYNENILEIETYLRTNYLVVDSDLNATITKIPEGGTQTSIWDQTQYPLQSIIVKNDVRSSFASNAVSKDQVDYKLYYIVLQEGGGTNPTTIDSTFVSYKGWNLKNEVFDQNNVGMWFSYPDVNQSISGFRQILPKIKTATASAINPDGSISYSNYGNILVFIPSGLSYFSTASAFIGAYSPIAFQIKLYANKQRDHDKDRILSKFEDVNNDGNYFLDDTDGDNIPDFLDVDDDGDGKLTKFEIKIPNVTPNQYYDFANIPICNSSGVKVHLNKNCR